MKKTALFFVLSISIIVLKAQPEPHREFNFGLPERQPEHTMPKSDYSIQTSVRKPKVNIPGGFTQISKQEYILSQGWEMIEADKLVIAPVSIFNTSLNTSEWYNATVPGTVLTTLVEQGVYPDPYWGLNNMVIPEDLCRMNWWYRNVFELPEDHKGEKIELIFNGINYFAEIWLNEKYLGTIRGAFRRGIYDVTDIVKEEGVNILAVKIIPPFNPGFPNEANSEDHGPNGGILCLDGPTFISSEGWDWVPGIRDRNIGIWQDVRLNVKGYASIIDPQIITDLPLPDTSKADIIIRTGLKNMSEQSGKFNINIEVENEISGSYPITMGAGEEKEITITPVDLPALKMQNPKLWWPNGYGEQNLYHMHISLTNDEGAILDEKTVRFGVREFDYELTTYNELFDSVRINFNPIEAAKNGTVTFDNIKRKFVGNNRIIPYLNYPVGSPGISMINDPEMGVHIVIKVNGQRIICKGGNWGMDDAMKNVSRDNLEPFFKLHKDLNFTMIRNWTGESTQASFYELADEYGMLIFNDFWLSTEGYNLNPSDNKLFLENVKETVIRYRNHPSLVIWCPRNEGFAPDSLEKYINMIIAEEDGTRHYMASSININMATSGPWQYIYNPGAYYELAGGFRTEVGAPSFPTAETVRKFMAEEDTWPMSDVWFYHDWLRGHWGSEPFIRSYEIALDDKFGGAANSLDEFSWRAQLLNYESYRAILEAWNSKMWNNSSGILLWMSHPAWNSFTWQTYSRDCETHGSYFGSKKACTPLHVQMNLNNHEIDIVNATLQTKKNLRVVAEVFNLDGNRIHSQNKFLEEVAANHKINALTLDKKPSFPELVFVKLYLYDSHGNLLDDNTYWMPENADKVDLSPFYKLAKASLSYKDFTHRKTSNGIEGSFTITNQKGIALAVKLSLREKADGRQVLPTLFSDGYFTLMPGESKRITFSADKEYYNTDEMGIFAEAFNMERKPLVEFKIR